MSRSSEAVKRWRDATKERMVSAMGGKCQCCGYNTCNSALAFHHINPAEKDIGFGGLRANPQEWVVVAQELRKCILLCHNCHSEVHAGIRQLPSTYATFNEEYAEYKPIVEYNDCPVCGSPKLSKLKFCSNKCATESKRKVDWNTVDLIDLMSKHTISELEDILGVSNAAIYKRRDQILKNKI